MLRFFGDAQDELEQAQQRYPALHSLHEAYAVILEEVDELKAEVWKKSAERDPEAIRSELVQIAAMCARTALECGLVPEQEGVTHANPLA